MQRKFKFRFLCKVTTLKHLTKCVFYSRFIQLFGVPSISLFYPIFYKSKFSAFITCFKNLTVENVRARNVMYVNVSSRFRKEKERKICKFR